MKELKFNEEMQRAKDEGRKTETRRVLEVDFYINDYTYEWTPDFVGDGYEHLFTNKRNGEQITIKCPYGKIGDTNNGCLITDIRVERLQDISEWDCIKEGVRYWADDNDVDLLDAIFKNYETGERNLVSAYSSFTTLWESIYPNHPTKGWTLNPYVWVITFEPIEL